MKDNNFSPRILYPTKLSLKIDRAIKVFHDKQKLKQNTNQAKLQKILHTEDESKENYDRMGKY
jgi:hypothetical protein